jgi:hypothetical protein
MHSHLRSKSRILVPDDGPSRPKRVAIIDDIVKRLLCLTVIHVYMPVLKCHITTGWIPLTLSKILCPSVHPLSFRHVFFLPVTCTVRIFLFFKVDADPV